MILAGNEGEEEVVDVPEDAVDMQVVRLHWDHAQTEDHNSLDHTSHTTAM